LEGSVTVLADEPTLKPGFFRLPDEPVDKRVLIPGFRAATRVRGAFGWFTAGWIGRLAPGLAIYLNRKEIQPMEFTVAPALYPNERIAIEQGVQMSSEQAAALVSEIFIEGRASATPLARHALDCLAWMIATEKLQLRIAVPTPESNYHPKLWLFDDGENRVLARGSGNATGRGVATGVEHLDVDVSWMAASASRVKAGADMLDDWSQGKSLGIKEVFSLPHALINGIIRTAPEHPPQPHDYHRVTPSSESDLGSARRPERRLSIPSDLEWNQGRYAHQGEAVRHWEGGDAPERGVIAMATGAGKTLTALICATRSQDRLNGQPFLIVVSAPSVPLVLQWAQEVKKFGVTPVIPRQTAKPELELTRLFRGLRGGGTHVVIVTNRLLCESKFQKTVAEKVRARNGVISTMLIADEAHSLGAESFIRNKPEFFAKRLALSATPERQYDPDGTEEIYSFFGPAVYEFGLNRAIGLCLVPYRYYIHACVLSDNELDEFARLSQRIGASANRFDTSEHAASLQRLAIARRRVIETASAKIELLRQVLLRRDPRCLQRTLIYASAKNPKQFDDIGKLLTKLDVRWAQVTQETTKKEKRLQRTLDSLAEGDVQVLLAKRVLDEGVDIPSVREAFIVASSTVEREWIQRSGRVLRMHADKPWATVHDFLALPPARSMVGDCSQSLDRLVESELARTHSFARYAQNFAGQDGVNADIDRLEKIYWPETPPSGNLLNRSGECVVARSTPRGKPW